MRLRGEIGLHRSIFGRWYVVERGPFLLDEERIIGQPAGYGSHHEASRWRRVYAAIRDLQVV